jgi:DNA-binding MarR family transcriptional regulator
MTDRTQPLDIGILMTLAYQEFIREMREMHTAAGFDDLGRSDGWVFRALAATPMTVGNLAIRLEISKQGAAQIIDDMERRGYVERRPDPTDRRARLVSLSARGDAALAAARAFHHRYELRLRQTHGPEAITALRRTLESMAGGSERTIDPRLRALYL